jgi:ketosteroid isomerase-like protein
MRRCLAMIFVFGALVAGSSQPASGQDLTAAQRAAIEQVVRDQAEALFAAIATLDAEKALTHFAEEDVVSVYNGVTDSSHEAFVSHIRGIEFMRRLEPGWDEARVYVLSSHAALLHGKFHAAHTYSDGKTKNIPAGFWTCLYRRVDGEWRIVLLHQSWDPSSVKEGEAIEQENAADNPQGG